MFIDDSLINLNTIYHINSQLFFQSLFNDVETRGKLK